jgi:AraC-like DNA-binding protein
VNKTETIEELYRSRCECIPEGLSSEIGHFNVFKMRNTPGIAPKPMQYKKRDFFKISLIVGKSKVHYADKTKDIQKHALVFSNPSIPYSWENGELIEGGYFCLFYHSFFADFVNFNKYSIFQPQGDHVFELTDEQTEFVQNLFEKMISELDSQYIYKYDVLRGLVMEIIHLALKTTPAANEPNKQMDASKRISLLFLELLERQFPIDDSHPQMTLRFAADFANQLNVHVNHLNRALKDSLGKTTSQAIGDRVLIESKLLLKESQMNVSDIAYALGFKETTHFNNFFKKNSEISPLKFRNV